MKLFATKPFDRALPAWLLLLSPAAIVLCILTVYPIVRVLFLSVFQTDYGFEDADFVGGENYTYLLSNSGFQRASWNTVVFTVMATASEVGLGLMLALLFNRRFPGRFVVIPIIVAPYVLATMVVTAIWRAWFHYDFGFLNKVLRAAHLPPVEWLFNPDIAMLSLVLVDIWQTAPFAFLILLAGLQSISPDVYEAARIDDARPVNIFFRITIPLLMPYILIAALLRSIESFKIFDKVYALTGGGPGRATETLSMYVYRLGFKFFDIGLASAAAVVMIVIAAALAAVYAIKLAGARAE